MNKIHTMIYLGTALTLAACSSNEDQTTYDIKEMETDSVDINLDTTQQHPAATADDTVSKSIMPE